MHDVLRCDQPRFRAALVSGNGAPVLVLPNGGRRSVAWKEGRKDGWKEGNVLFNNALNTCLFYGYMASDIC